jgi:hypothetical protein
MLSRAFIKSIRAQQQHGTQLFSGMAIIRRFVSGYASDDILNAWKDPHKQDLAKHFVLGTLVHTPSNSRGYNTEAKLRPERHTKVPHPTTRFSLAHTYGELCAVDKIPFGSAEHGFLMRVAVAAARAPSQEVLEAVNIISIVLSDKLRAEDRHTFKSIFDIGANIEESRSKMLIGNQQEFIRHLASDKVPPQKKLRVLEAALSPIGMTANAFGTKFCKIAYAKKNGKEVKKLCSFFESLMPSLQQFHVPYIKAPGSPFAHLQMQAYKEGAPISNEDLITEAHFLECVGNSPCPEVPQLRSVVVKDKTGRSIELHDRYNLPHFFDVSGTTGAVMQVAMGMLKEAGRLDLVDTPEKIQRLGMILAGCNFYKQGFHNFYEVLPALSWVTHHVLKDQPYIQRTPSELVSDVAKVIEQSVDKSNSVCQLVPDIMRIVSEHAEIHRQAYMRYVEQIQNEQKDNLGFVSHIPGTPMR